MGLVKKSNNPSEQHCFDESEPAVASVVKPLPYEGLIQQSLSTDSSEKRQAIKHLADHPQSIPHLVELLAQNQQQLIRQTIFDSLRRIAFDAVYCNDEQQTRDDVQAISDPQHRVVSCTLSLISHRDALLRNQVICFVSEFPEVIARHIPNLLQSSDQETRLYTLDILQYLMHPAIPQWLANCLRTEQDINVLTSAIDRAVIYGCHELVDDIAAAGQRNQTHPMVKFAADMAVQRLGGI